MADFSSLLDIVMHVADDVGVRVIFDYLQGKPILGEKKQAEKKINLLATITLINGEEKKEELVRWYTLLHHRDRAIELIETMLTEKHVIGLLNSNASTRHEFVEAMLRDAPAEDDKPSSWRELYEKMFTMPTERTGTEAIQEEVPRETFAEFWERLALFTKFLFSAMVAIGSILVGYFVMTQIQPIGVHVLVVWLTIEWWAEPAAIAMLFAWAAVSFWRHWHSVSPDSQNEPGEGEKDVS